MGGRGKGRRKPAKKNSFMIFTEEFREKQSQLGIKYPTLEEAIKAASPHWNKLPAHEKANYTKQVKELYSGVHEKYTSEGIRISDISNHQNAMRQQKEFEEAYIDDIIKQSTMTDTFSEISFCIIHTNFYSVTNDGLYSTCEVAVSLFNLKMGVQYTYHCIVDAVIPLGYAYDASVKSKEIGISLPPVENSEHDLIKIYTQLYGICTESQKENKGMLPVFAMPDDIEPANNFLEQICQAAGADDCFKVYSLPLLLYKLRHQISIDIKDLGIPSVPLASNELSTDRFAFSYGLSCDLHKDSDEYHRCSLSKVQRLAFMICDHCCGPIGIPVISGKHFPRDAKFMNSPVRIVHEPINNTPKNTDDAKDSAEEPKKAWKIEAPSNYVPIRQPFDCNLDAATSGTKLIDKANPWNKNPMPSSSGNSGNSGPDGSTSFPELSTRGRGYRSFTSPDKFGRGAGGPSSIRPNLPGRGRGSQK